MRIAVLTSEFPSVSETFVLQHVADLVDRGHQVDVFPQQAGEPSLHPEMQESGRLGRLHPPTPFPTCRGERILRAARLAIERGARDASPLLGSVAPWRFGRRGLSLSLLFRQIPLLERRHRYDVVHCHHGPVGLDAAHLQRLGVLRGPLVTSFHGFDVNVAPRRGGRRMYAPLLRRASLLLVNSGFLREGLIALGAPPERVRVHPAGVRPSEFASARPEQNHGELRLVSVGRLVEVKGFDVALRAFAQLAAAHPQWRYVLIGDGPLRPELEGLTRALGIAPRVHFAGALPHDAVRRELGRAQLYCQPSVPGSDGARESLGLAAIEAQASGLPVIASRSGGLPESVRDGESGILVPPGDAASLARALDALLTHPERRAALGRAARHFAATRFDRAALMDRLLTLYAGLARPSFARARSAAPRARQAP